MNGEVHGVGMEPSTEHMNVTPDWSELNVNVALWRPLSAGGADVIVVSGSPTTVQVYLAAVGSTCSKMSMARTSRVCCPASRPSSSSTASQPENCSPSSEHSNSSTISLLWNPKMTSGPETGPGPWAITVSGASRSIGGITSHS